MTRIIEEKQTFFLIVIGDGNVSVEGSYLISTNGSNFKEDHCVDSRYL